MCGGGGVNLCGCAVNFCGCAGRTITVYPGLQTLWDPTDFQQFQFISNRHAEWIKNTLCEAPQSQPWPASTVRDSEYLGPRGRISIGIDTIGIHGAGVCAVCYSLAQHKTIDMTDGRPNCERWGQPPPSCLQQRPTEIGSVDSHIADMMFTGEQATVCVCNGMSRFNRWAAS